MKEQTPEETWLHIVMLELVGMEALDGKQRQDDINLWLQKTDRSNR